MTGKVFLGAFLIGQILLGAGWFLAGYWQGGVLITVLCFSYFYLFLKKYSLQLTGIFFFISVVMAGIGIWGKVNSWLMIGSAAFMLAAWDLDHFKNQLSGIPASDRSAELEIRHFLTLVSALIAGVCLILISRAIQLKPGFEWSLALAAMAFAGTAALIYFSKPSEK